MSSAERHLNQSSSKTQQAIETIYTTVESQPDQTDWLTVVSNLRQINRQLVEQIARLEHNLASSQQALSTHTEEKQSHEITILQQQDELKITHERVGTLFQQLETSHQIGQRQQILVETLSQQLEIAHTIVSQLETENNEISQQSQQQAEKLAQTEQIALELHNRLQQTIQAPKPIAETTATAIPATMLTPSRNAEIAEIVAEINGASISDPQIPDPFQSSVEQNTVQHSIESPTILDEELVPIWTPTPPATRQEEPIKTPSQATTPPRNTTVSLPRSTSQLSWREDTPNPKIPSNYKPNSEPIVNPKPSATPTPPPPAEIVNKESNGAETDGTIAKPALNWPAPTVTKSSSGSSGKSIVDVPKFPRK